MPGFATKLDTILDDIDRKRLSELVTLAREIAKHIKELLPNYVDDLPRCFMVGDPTWFPGAGDGDRIDLPLEGPNTKIVAKPYDFTTTDTGGYTAGDYNEVEIILLIGPDWNELDEGYGRTNLDIALGQLVALLGHEYAHSIDTDKDPDDYPYPTDEEMRELANMRHYLINGREIRARTEEFVLLGELYDLSFEEVTRWYINAFVALDKYGLNPEDPDVARVVEQAVDAHLEYATKIGVLGAVAAS